MRGLRSIDLDRLERSLPEGMTEDMSTEVERMIQREEELRRLRNMRSQELETYWVGVAQGKTEPSRRT